METRNFIKTAKGKIAISGLILTLGLSGCSFGLNKSSDTVKNKVLIETNDEYDYGLDNDRLDDIMGFTKEIKENAKYLDYTYLIDYSETTTLTLAHVIDEKIITNDGKMFDGKKEMTSRTFGEDIIQPIVLPIAFTLFHVDDMATMADAYGTCEINGKKMITLDGDILYYFDSIVTFNSFAERVIGLDLVEGDTMRAKALYKLNPNGQLELLYRNQEGFRADTPNVVELNYNNSREIVIPIEETVLSDMDGKYTEKEATAEIKEYKKY